MAQLNYHHLYYFYITAKEGSVTKAAKILCVTPQTVSGQLSKFEEHLGFSLFDRKNKKLFLNTQGNIAYRYAEKIYNLGQTMLKDLNVESSGHIPQFTIGVTDAVPKVFTFDLLKDTMKAFDKTCFVFKEGDFHSLHDSMNHNKIDLILSDNLPNLVSLSRFHSYYLGETGISFFAKNAVNELKESFPRSLTDQPFLISGDKSHLKTVLETWLAQHDIIPSKFAEFEDSALLKLMGGQGLGIFTAPSIIKKDVEQQYRVSCIGQTDEIKESFYATVHATQKHSPIVQHILKSSKDLFVNT